MGKANEAYNVYEQALEFEPDNPDLHYNLGVVLIELGKPTKALEMFNNALMFDPEHLQSLMNRYVHTCRYMFSDSDKNFTGDL